MKNIKAEKIAKKAGKLVGGSRNRNHGEMHDNFANIAHAWNAILIIAGKGGRRGLVMCEPLNAHDVANMMEGLKIARRYSGAFNVDDYVDGAGYAACAGELGAPG